MKGGDEMGLKDHYKDVNWLGNRDEKVQELISIFCATTNRNIQNYYDKDSFCSGFMKEHFIIESDGEIFAMTDSGVIYQRDNDGWEVVK